MITNKKHTITKLASIVALGFPLLVQPLTAHASDPFIAEVSIFAGNFAPRGWAFCNGQLLPIAQNTALFSLVGTTYGGDGRSTLGLPDLQGRAVVHAGRGPGLTDRRLGSKGGSATTTLGLQHLPSHRHAISSVSGGITGIQLRASSANGDQHDAANHSEAPGGARSRDYQSAAPDVAMHADSITLSAQFTLSTTGGNQSYNNMQPYLGVNHIIALQGLYPSRS